MQKVILPFLSGFLAALFFREATLALLHTADLIAATGFSTQPFAPLGIPEFVANALISACFAFRRHAQQPRHRNRAARA
ncbi:hypothetical protein QM306_41040, partial [Burkholderia cenocepacia]|nr:hypothetical protein [Burkholderia cenocepacia]